MIIPPRAILFDANLLLLLAVGLFDRSLIGRRRLDEFTVEDFDFLIDYAHSFSNKLTIPHVLAEVSNLSDYCVSKARLREFRAFFSEFVKGLDEQWAAAVGLCAQASFSKLGLSDAAISELATARTEVISVDLDLCIFLEAKGVPVTNFNR